MENIFNSVLSDVLLHVDSSDTNNMNTSFFVENGHVVMKQGAWSIQFEGDGIVRIDNPEYGFGSQAYDDHAFYAKNGDFIETCKKRYINEYHNGKVWEAVHTAIKEEVKAYEEMYAKGRISIAYKNKMLLEINSIHHRKELFDAMK